MATLRNGRWVNWAGNQSCSPAVVEHPATEGELCDLVKRAADQGQVVRVVGSGHSFTDCATTDDVLAVLDRYDQLISIDQTARRITVQAGMPLRALNETLLAVGLALPNLGDIQYQTVAGALATSTHGTGATRHVLAQQIVGFTLVTADGSVLRCDPDSEAEVFHCDRVAFGTLGILSEITLQAVPAFRLHATEAPMKTVELLERVDELVDGNDFFEAYWVPHTRWCLTKSNNVTDEPVSGLPPVKRFLTKTVLENVAFGAAVKAGRISSRLGTKVAKVLPSTGTTEFVDTSHRVFTSERWVRFVEMEYSMPRDALAPALSELVRAHEKSGMYVSFPVELRWVKGDDIPLSTASGRDSSYIAVHMAKGTPHEAWFRLAESIFDAYDGRPHWGKLHYQTAATLAGRYPQWDRFQSVRRSLDPDGRFANRYSRRVLGA
jgi:FAD-linked oxidoreductase